jgi:hypothetical protein
MWRSNAWLPLLANLFLKSKHAIPQSRTLSNACNPRCTFLDSIFRHGTRVRPWQWSEYMLVRDPSIPTKKRYVRVEDDPTDTKARAVRAAGGLAETVKLSIGTRVMVR